MTKCHRQYDAVALWCLATCRTSLLILRDQGTKWTHEVLDPMGMSASGSQETDLNGDSKLDIVMIGGATHNIKWYENLGLQSSQTTVHR